LPDARKGTSLWADAWRRLRRNWLAVGGACALVLVAVACFVGPPVLAANFGLRAESQDVSPKDAYLAPSGDHPFGTDEVGLDYLVRVLEGGQTSLLIGLVATVVSVLVGVVYGAFAGYYGGRLDEILMRLVDFIYGIPYMFLVILVMLLLSDQQRQSAVPMFFALGLVQWLTMARIVRGQVLTLRHQEFVQAARVMGASDMRILFRHILPNTLGVVVVYATLTVPAVIILEAFLSFLGLGVENSWGRLVAKGVEVVNPIRSYWWLLVFPSLFLAVTLFSLNFLGDGLRDALDPRTRKQ
jgi:oligopeptide transport system permease protein